MAEIKKEVVSEETTKRLEKAVEEINAIQEKYQVALVAQLSYSEGGIVPKISVVDTKKEEKLADAVK